MVTDPRFLSSGPEVQGGPRSFNLQRDEFGHRTYKVKHLVRAATADGPWNVANAAGLPAHGSYWQFNNDYDGWAWCRWDADVKIHQEREGDPTVWWVVEQTFSTKPPFGPCRDYQVTDPLLEPNKISGSFAKYMEEATHDRFGRFLQTSSFEQLRGPQVEFDRNRPTVRIEQNVADLQLPLLAAMVDTVNDSPLWGLPPRCIKLSNVSWSRNYYGLCYCYYTRTLEFDVNFETFDRLIIDEGNKVLRGHWNVVRCAEGGPVWELERVCGVNPNPRDPRHFIRYKDANSENSRVILNGAGVPAGIVPGVDDTLSTPCCGAVGKILNGIITQKTGDCTCLPDIVIFTSQVFAGGAVWSAPFAACGIPAYDSTTAVGSEFQLTCATGGTTCNNFNLEFRFVDVTHHLHTLGTVTMLECNCNPLKLVYHIEFTGSPCQGGIDLTITAAQVAIDAGVIPVQKYNEANMFLLGIPLTFNC